MQKIFKTPMPKWWTKELGEEIRKAAKFYLETLSYNPELIKLNGGAMVKRMLRNMNSTSKRKVYLYSGHEFTVYALAKAHKVTLDQSPPFGSALILEKHRDAQGHSYVKVRPFSGNLSIRPKVRKNELGYPAFLPRATTCWPFRFTYAFYNTNNE